MSSQTETHQVPGLKEPIRLSDYSGGIFNLIPSRKGMKKAIDRGWVKINGERASTADHVSGGDTIELTILDEKPRPEIDLKLDVIYEDDFLAVINKPAGIEVSGNRRWTVENALRKNLSPSSEVDALTYPEAIHRLDYPTTGALLIGKTRKAVSELNRMFAENEIKKTYWAVTIGEMKTEGEIDLPIDEKPSLSKFNVLNSIHSERFGKLNLVELHPKTGRRHQLRKHLASNGNPILGDRDYGLEGLILKGKGLYLHSKSLSFSHPFLNEQLAVEASVPKKILKLFP